MIAVTVAMLLGMPIRQFRAFVQTLTPDQAQLIMEVMRLAVEASQTLNAEALQLGHATEQSNAAVDKWLNTTVIVPDTILQYIYTYTDVA